MTDSYDPRTAAHPAATLVAALALSAIAAPSHAVVTAYSTINLQDPTPIAGVPNGPRDTETDYIPNVVRSENGLASFEALKAQAVAARTFAYYKMQTAGSIDNGTNDQVYKTSASNTPSQIHYDAALATEGEILTHPDLNFGDVIASFYVAGGIPTGGAPLNDLGNNIGSDPTGTEQFVTYNLGNTGSAASLGTSLGFIGNVRNRGAKSQNGADYLSDNSVNYMDILRYYYGAEIRTEVATPVGGSQSYGRKVLADFDDYGSGRVSDGIIAGNEGVFGWSPTFSGSTVGVNAATADRSNAAAHEGTHSQRIDFDYDEGFGSDFTVRHLAGANATFNITSNIANDTGNLMFEPVGAVGLWLMTNDPGLSVSIAMDDPTTGDRGIKKNIVADGQWRKYQWFLDEDTNWEAWLGAGNGQIDGSLVSLDSIQFFGATDATLFMDTVFWDPAAVIPTPATATLLAAGTLVLTRRRPRPCPRA